MEPSSIIITLMDFFLFHLTFNDLRKGLQE